jgi:uncharacterized protein (TIGR03437 family)
MDTGAGWLNVTQPATSAVNGTPATVQVSVNGSSLAAGTYAGHIIITATSGGVNAPTSVNVPVTFNVAAGTLSVTPSSLTFNAAQGSPAQSQDLTVSGTPGALNFTVTYSTGITGNWLGVSAASGTTPATIHVTANPAGLQPGTYNGTVKIDAGSATGSPQTINVTLNVVAAQTFSVSSSTLNFSYNVGASAPASQTVTLTSSGGAASFTATPSTGATWLTLTPTTGTTPASLTLGVNTAGLTTAGNFTASIAITSPASATSPAATINVNLTVTLVPKPVFTTVSNAASYTSGAISPGENIVIFGTGIGPATLAMGQVMNNAFTTQVGNTQVTFDGIAAPIIYASAGQTSVMVPYGVAGRPSTSIRIIYQGVQSDAITYNVTGSAPGIYTANASGSGPGAILNQDFSVNTAAKPAAIGSTIAVYMTGEGSTQPASSDGVIAPVNGTGLYKPILPVTATVGGLPATVAYYGSAPGIVYGVMQVNVTIPAGVTPGPSVPVVITVGTNQTQSGAAPVTVAVSAQ